MRLFYISTFVRHKNFEARTRLIITLCEDKNETYDLKEDEKNKIRFEARTHMIWSKAVTDLKLRNN